jgi:hypothetical protein
MDRRNSSPDALLGSFLSSLSRTRRLEDRIRNLCLEATTAADPAELNLIMERLKAALHDHATRIRSMVALPPSHRDRRKPTVN